jgi:hypothetical protein
MFSKKFGSFRITMTKHGLERIAQRRIPGEEVTATILQVAEQNLFQDRGQYMIENRQNRFSLVVAVHKDNIKIVTALSNTGCYRKAGTELIAV